MKLLNLKDITISELSLALTNHQIKNEIDEDGDIVLSRGGNHAVLKIDEGKIKFFGISEFQPKHNIEKLTAFIEKINYIGEELRFTIMEADKDKGVKIFFSAAFIRNGLIDDVFLTSTINLCFDELDRLIVLFPSMVDMLNDVKGL